MAIKFTSTSPASKMWRIDPPSHRKKLQPQKSMAMARLWLGIPEIGLAIIPKKTSSEEKPITIADT